jgi:hypothetical protein
VRGCPGHLERLAAPVGGEADDPQVAVLVGNGILVADGDPHDGHIAVDRDHLGVHRERLVGSPPLCLPHVGDRAKPNNRRLERLQAICRAVGEQLAQRFGSRASPRLLISGQPSLHVSAVDHRRTIAPTTRSRHEMAALLGIGR